MKRLFFRFSISIFTFAVGSSVVWLTGLLPTLSPHFADKPVATAVFYLKQVSIPMTETSHQKPQFEGTMRGCGGFGYDQGYKTDDGQHLTEGFQGYSTRRKARAEFKKQIAKAVRVVERVPNYKHPLHGSGERVVLVNPPDKRNNEETVSILWHDEGRIIARIDAPSLELALEFERFLEATDYTAHGF